MTVAAIRRTSSLVPLMRQVARMMQSRVAAHFGAADISYPQWNSLRCIDQLGCVNTRALAAELDVTPQAAIRIVVGLEARGLVVRDIQGARRTWVRSTPAGLVKLREAASEIDQRLAKGLAGLTDSEIDTLFTLLGRLADCFDRCAGPLACNPAEA